MSVWGAFLVLFEDVRGAGGGGRVTWAGVAEDVVGSWRIVVDGLVVADELGDPCGQVVALQGMQPAVRPGTLSVLWPGGTPRLDPSDPTEVVVAPGVAGAVRS